MVQEKFNHFDTVKHRVMDLVKKETGIDLAGIDPDQDILEQVTIDSMQLIEIYAAIIEELGIDAPMSIVQAKTLNGIITALAKVMNRARIQVSPSQDG